MKFIRLLETEMLKSSVEILDLILKKCNANLFLADFGVVELMCAIRLSSYAVLAFPLYVL